MSRLIRGRSYSFTPSANNAITLNGSSQYGKVLNSVSINALSTFTIEGWFKQNSSGGIAYAPVVRIESASLGLVGLTTENATPSSGSNWGVTYSTTNADGYTTDSVFPVSTWAHVAIVHNAATKVTSIFRNGVEVAYGLQRTGVGTLQSPSTMDVWYGVNSPLTQFFKGDVGGFLRIWNVARTSAQLLTNKSYYLDPTQETGLIHAFYFGEGSGTTVANQVSGENIMTLFNTPSWTTGPIIALNPAYNARVASGTRTTSGTRTLII